MYALLYSPNEKRVYSNLLYIGYILAMYIYKTRIGPKLASLLLTSEVYSIDYELGNPRDLRWIYTFSYSFKLDL